MTEDSTPKKRFLKLGIKRYLVAGLLVWAPLGITFWVLHFLVSSMDSMLKFLPTRWTPDFWLGVHIPGFGVLLAFVLLLVTGIFAANFLGEKVITAWEHLLTRIPFVKSVYSSVKQVSETILSDKGNAFRQALLVEFPKEGVWTVAFQTGDPAPEIAQGLPEPHVSVYVPTTPNPTSGYFLIVPYRLVKPLNMSVDEALKYIVSMGVIVPQEKVKTMIAENRQAKEAPDKSLA
jgi:uncharacterized membrane protein